MEYIYIYTECRFLVLRPISFSLTRGHWLQSLTVISGLLLHLKLAFNPLRNGYCLEEILQDFGWPPGRAQQLLHLPGQWFSTQHRSRAQDGQDMARRFFRWKWRSKKKWLAKSEVVENLENFRLISLTGDMYDSVVGCLKALNFKSIRQETGHQTALQRAAAAVQCQGKKHCEVPPESSSHWHSTAFQQYFWLFMGSCLVIVAVALCHLDPFGLIEAPYQDPLRMYRAVALVESAEWRALVSHLDLTVKSWRGWWRDVKSAVGTVSRCPMQKNAIWVYLRLFE